MNIRWYRHLIDAVDVKKHLFWHSSSVTATTDIHQDLVLSMPDGQVLNIVDCKNLPLLPNHDLDVSALDTLVGDALVVLNFDALLSLSHGRTWMRQLRPAVVNHLRRGTRLIVASKRPQSEYPAIDGSSLATDCVQHMGAPLRFEDFREHMTADDATRLVRLSAGLAGPASQIVSSHPRLETVSGKDAVAYLEKHITKAMIQCGPEPISWLENNVLLRNDRKLHYEDIPSNVAAAIQGAGLAVVDARTDCLEVLPGVSNSVVKTSIEMAERSFLDAPKQWKEVAGALFTFERTARKLLAESVSTPDGLAALLSTHSDKIRRNFATENGIPAPALAELPNPVRWIDLSDLLELLIQTSSGSRLGGLSNKQWAAAKSDILPIRNKIQHMRLPSTGDRQVVERYNRNLRG